MKGFNDRVALWAVRTVGTMGCAYVFALLALCALPSAIHDSFAQGSFDAMPLVTWLSQSFLQLVLLSVIMAGQTLQAKRGDEQHAEIRAHHQGVREMIARLGRGGAHG